VADNGLLVRGAPGTGLVRPPVIGSVADAVGREAECPVIIAKRRGESRLDRLLERVGSLSGSVRASPEDGRRRR
jgi:hypothetical protein